MLVLMLRKVLRFDAARTPRARRSKDGCPCPSSLRHTNQRKARKQARCEAARRPIGAPLCSGTGALHIARLDKLDGIFRVGSDFAIVGQEGHAFGSGLRNQHAVERIGVMPLKVGNISRVATIYRQLKVSVVEK